MPRFPGAQLTRSVPNAAVIGGDSINPQPQGSAPFKLTRLTVANDCTPTGLEPAFARMGECFAYGYYL